MSLFFGDQIKTSDISQYSLKKYVLLKLPDVIIRMEDKPRYIEHIKIKFEKLEDEERKFKLI